MKLRSVLISMTMILFFLAPVMTNAEPYLKWGAIDGAQGYKIFWGTASGVWTQERNVGAVLQYPLSGLSLQDDTQYYFMVKAFDGSGDGNPSNVVDWTIVAVDTTPPLVPQNVQRTIDGNSVTVTWNTNSESDFAGYRMYFREDGGTYGPYESIGNVTSYTKDGLTAGQTYFFSVSAVDTNGNESQKSEVSASIAAADTTPPTIAISSPNNGGPYETNAATIDIEGTAADAVDVSGVSWTNSKGGNGDAVGTVNWSISGLPLQAGVNVITIKAVDSAGNQGTISYNITYTPADDSVPTVAITSPTSQATYTTDQLTVQLSGTASDNDVIDKVSWSNSTGDNGVASGTDNWSVDVTLQSGSNVITITAQDAAGNEGVATLTIDSTAVDANPPVLTITLPTSEPVFDTVQSTIQFSGTAEDDGTVTEVRWTNSTGGSGVAVGTANWNIDSISLQMGDNIIAIVAVDDKGNESTKTVTVSYVPPDEQLPVISIASPATSPYTTGQSPIRISGTASDNTGIKRITWQSGSGVSGVATGTTDWSIANVSLVAGENVIVVKAFDLADNSASELLTVIYSPADSEAPIVKIASPTEDDAYNTQVSTIQLSGYAPDNVGTISVFWVNSRGGSGTASGQEAWSIADIQLLEGENVITVTAEDAQGNKGSDSITVTYAEYTPASTSTSTLPMEFGEIEITNQIHAVTFTRSYQDPVVIVKPLSMNNTDPAIVRVAKITATGFEVRIQEWGYLDGTHPLEKVGYLVIESGNHTLADGTKVEAGKFTTKTTRFRTFPFGKTFSTTPVLMTSVVTQNENDAVIGRIKSVTISEFKYMLQEQESNAKRHHAESVCYLAWEPSSGVVNGKSFHVGTTGQNVSNSFYNLTFNQSFTNAPVFIADMQSANSINPANIRWRNKTAGGVEIAIDEEQSRDREVRHAAEDVGYVLFSQEE